MVIYLLTEHFIFYHVPGRVMPALPGLRIEARAFYGTGEKTCLIQRCFLNFSMPLGTSGW